MDRSHVALACLQLRAWWGRFPTATGCRQHAANPGVRWGEPRRPEPKPSSAGAPQQSRALLHADIKPLREESGPGPVLGSCRALQLFWLNRSNKLAKACGHPCVHLSPSHVFPHQQLRSCSVCSWRGRIVCWSPALQATPGISRDPALQDGLTFFVLFNSFWPCVPARQTAGRRKRRVLQCH